MPKVSVFALAGLIAPITSAWQKRTADCVESEKLWMETYAEFLLVQLDGGSSEVNAVSSDVQVPEPRR